MLAMCLAGALPAIGASEIYRCSSAGGVTYQQVPCDEGKAGGVTPIPADFPPVNTEARERLFAREAALDKRLEAQRERWMKEAALREAREERAALERERLAAASAAAAAAVAPQFIVVRRPPRHWRGVQPLPVR